MCGVEGLSPHTPGHSGLPGEACSETQRQTLCRTSSGYLASAALKGRGTALSGRVGEILSPPAAARFKEWMPTTASAAPTSVAPFTLHTTVVTIRGEGALGLSPPGACALAKGRLRKIQL